MKIKGISLKDLAIYISDYLRKNGIETVLSGGACVTIYTDNKYLTSLRALDLSQNQISDIYIIPELLPSQRPAIDFDAFHAPGSLHFLYQVIDSHLKKLFSYDPAGVKENFIIVYAETDDLSGLWEKYLQHILEINFECPLHGKVEEESSDYANIKLTRAQHIIERTLCDVFHLFIKMPYGVGDLLKK
jgi:hypothetical protein